MLTELTNRYWKAIVWFSRKDITEARKLSKIDDFDRIRVKLRDLEVEIEANPNEALVLSIFGGRVLNKGIDFI